MKLIIEIPEKVVTAIQNGEDYRYDIHTAIAQGIPYNPSGDLISREALKKEFKAIYHCAETMEEVANTMEDAIDNAPTLEVYTKDDMTKEYLKGYNDCKEMTERQKGEWYYSIDKGWECNQCHEIVKDMPTCMRKALYNFCPNCGADMRKGGAE